MVAPHRLLVLDPEVFLDRVAHELQFLRGFAFGFEPEPGFTVGCIDDETHVS